MFFHFTGFSSMACTCEVVVTCFVASGSCLGGCHFGDCHWRLSPWGFPLRLEHHLLTNFTGGLTSEYMSIPADWIFYIEGSYAYTCHAGLKPTFHHVEVESCFAQLVPGGVPTMAKRIVRWRSLASPDIRIYSTHWLSPLSYRICLISGVG